MGRLFPIIVFFMPIVLVGCRSNSRSELIEAELRTKDRELRELQGRVQSLELMNHSLEGELLHRNGLAPAPNPSSAIVGPKDIILGAGTGGIRGVADPGDTGIEVVVLPRDEDQNPVRALGELVVYAFEIQPGGTKTPLCGWNVGIDELRRTWNNGLISKGYFVVLPWKRLPSQPKLKIVAQLRLPDGRVLETEKEISIRPPKKEVILPAQPPALEEIAPEVPGPSLSKRAAEITLPIRR